MKTNIYKFTTIGRIHSEMGVTNQDHITSYRDDNISILVVCDVAGGCRAGDTAALLVSDALREFLYKNFELLYNSEGWMIRKRISEMIDRLLDGFSAEHHDIPRKELGTTIMAAAMNHKKEILTVHLGDGCIHFKRKDGSFGTVSHPQNEFYDRTYLTSGEVYPHLRVCRYDDPDLQMLLLATDGVSDESLEQAEKVLEEDCSVKAFFKVTNAIEASHPDDDATIAYIYVVD